MGPRQLDIEARSLARETRAGVDRGDFKLSKKTIGTKTSNQKSLPIPALLKLTDNFFPRKSCGTTRIVEILIHLSTERIFTDSTSESNPDPSFQGALLCTKLQQFIARCLVHKYYTTPARRGLQEWEKLEDKPKIGIVKSPSAPWYIKIMYLNCKPLNLVRNSSRRALRGTSCGRKLKTHPNITFSYF